MICTICKRDVSEDYVEKHHLVPKSRKGKETIFVCYDCGNQIHKLFTNKELENEYNTLEKLLSSEKINKWIKWIRKKSRVGFCAKSKKRKLK